MLSLCTIHHIHLIDKDVRSVSNDNGVILLIVNIESTQKMIVDKNVYKHIVIYILSLLHTLARLGCVGGDTVTSNTPSQDNDLRCQHFMIKVCTDGKTEISKFVPYIYINVLFGNIYFISYF